MHATERPLIFDAESVRGILSGHKTQTRRPVIVAGFTPALFRNAVMAQDVNITDAGAFASALFYNDSVLPDKVNTVARCRHGKPGGLLWVRETFGIVPWTAYAHSEGIVQTRKPDPDQPNGYDIHDAAVYKAGWDRGGAILWQSSLYMPRWASRISLLITAIRVERLQRISASDCEAELGAERFDLGDDARRLFRDRWQQINGKHRGWTWDDNPWVWAITFSRVRP